MSELPVNGAHHSGRRGGKSSPRRLPILALVLWAAAAGAAERVFEFGPAPAGYTGARRLRYGFTASNTGKAPLREARLRVAAPAPHTAAQWCARLACTHEAERVADTNGNQVLLFRLDGLPPYGQRVISIDAEVFISDRPDPTDPADPAHRTARAAFDRVVGTLVYDGYHQRDRGAAWALEHGRGDCTEFAAAFVALCRAGGVPARRVSGYRCSRARVLSPFEFHTWAEFHDGRAWRPVDPLYGRFPAPPAGAIAFILHAHAGPPAALFRCEGENLAVSMNE